jgi:hypothetical protein
MQRHDGVAPYSWLGDLDLGWIAVQTNGGGRRFHDPIDALLISVPGRMACDYSKQKHE